MSEWLNDERLIGWMTCLAGRRVGWQREWL